jgi:2-amino-4-hydroxy-6-hydroxymethyldihydropteridine diphosphokinase
MALLVSVAIGIGSNKGDRLDFLKKASDRLMEDAVLQGRSASVYETEAWGGVTDKAFLNTVVVGQTDWKPPALVSYLKELERELGRTLSVRYGDREIDLDLLAYGSEIWNSEGVQVPHPRMAERDFVLVPLAEVWPEWTHPVLGQTAVQLKGALGPSSIRVFK